jgi:hypothetical protein
MPVPAVCACFLAKGRGKKNASLLGLRVFENKVLMVFGPRTDKVTWDWRRLHSKKLYALYSSPNIIRVIKY